MIEPRAVFGGHLQDGVEIAIVAVHVKDAGTAAAVERLDDHFAPELVEERLQARNVGGNEARVG